MNRRDFIKMSATGLGTILVSGAGWSLLTQKQPEPAAAPVANAAPAAAATANGSQKIVVITGSPHRNGTSALLADKFIEGAQANGHQIYRFNAAFEDIHPCRACNACHRDGPCIQNDAIEQKLMPQLLEADIIALVTPLYYYGMSTQLKTCVDRMYSHLRRFDGKKSLLLTTAWNSAGWTFEALVDHYKSLTEYMHWQDLGTVLGYGCGYRSACEASPYPEESLQLGRRV